MWIGTAKGGLNRLPLRKDGENLPRISAYSTHSGMFSDEIFEILEDSHGWLWMSCSKGVFRVKKRDFASVDEGNRDSLVSLVYGKSDGMESPQCNCNGKPAAIKAQDGKFYFATTKGLAAVDPESVSVNLAPPPVHIEQLVADKRYVVDFTSEFHSQENAAVASLSFMTDEAGPGIKIPPGRGDLEFDYTALTFQSPQDTQFKYKLEGVNNDWVDAGTRRVAFYNNVAPGRHRFRVMASNKDGAWNERGAGVIFTIEPHFWQSWWWRGAMVVGIIALVSGSVRYTTHRRLQRKLDLLEQRNAIERERGRIAKDIHDDLGSSLTRIMMLGERAEEDLESERQVDGHIGKIVTTARHTVQALDEIVWAVNPENDTLDGLVQYISHYADEFFENSDVSCLLDIPTDLPDATLSAEFRHDLFLVVKESFNNVLKHSHATRVRLQVTASADAIDIVIEDNGSGFDPNEPRDGRKGNGLFNMRKRANAIAAEFSVTSIAGSGTTIRIKAPLRVSSYNHTVGLRAERG
jgi:signal transduction histidine kinase